MPKMHYFLKKKL